MLGVKIFLTILCLVIAFLLIALPRNGQETTNTFRLKTLSIGSVLLIVMWCS